MESDASDARQVAGGSKGMFWGGWVLSGLVGAGLIFSAVMKLARPEEVLKEFARLGYPESTIGGIGITELVIAIVYLVPRTSVLGAILVAGYLGGATASHVSAGDPFIAPIVMGVLAWLGLYLRYPRLRELIPLKR